ncbi:MAG: hypothetical protein QOD75_3031 [Blastocatellia bacterium]|jgi:hypothetical protein|nr:hypothetical protein [Blastocatellia bacterium]
MAVENAILGVSLLAIAYPVADLVWSFISEVRAKRLLVTDQDGEVLAEFSTERVQQTDLKDLEQLHERVRRDKGTALRAA